MLRLPLAAAFVAFDAVWVRATVLTVGALTDALDGWIARRHGQMSLTGALLDALFDKLFALVALTTFVVEGQLGFGSFLILIARDLYTGLGYLGGRLLKMSVPVQARVGGKVVTVLQIATLYVLIFAPDRVVPFVVAVAIASAYAIADYTLAGWRAVRSPV